MKATPEEIRKAVRPGLIQVRIPKAVLLLTEAEYRRGILRAKWWRRQETLARRIEGESGKGKGREAITADRSGPEVPCGDTCTTTMKRQR